PTSPSFPTRRSSDLPEVSGRQVALVVRQVAKHAAAETHAAQIDDRLAEHRKLRRGDPVRSAGESLGLGDEQLVVDAPLSGMPLVAVRVLGRNAHVART